MIKKAILIIDIPEAFEADLRKGKLRSEFNVFNDEELIEEVIKARIAEARLKKGYEVKGDGSVIRYVSRNTK